MTERNCSKCVYHEDGGCTRWECKGSVTVADVKRKAVKEFAEWLANGNTFIRRIGTDKLTTIDEVLDEYEKEQK